MYVVAYILGAMLIGYATLAALLLTGTGVLTAALVAVLVGNASILVLAGMACFVSLTTRRRRDGSSEADRTDATSSRTAS